MLNKLFNIFRHKNTPKSQRFIQPDNIQNQAIDITDSIWNTYQVAHMKYFHHKKYSKMSGRKISKKYPLFELHGLRMSPVYKWINELVSCWTVMSEPDNNIYRVKSVLEDSHSDNFYEITMHEQLYMHLKAFLLKRQKQAFSYPYCFPDKTHGRILLPGDEQHFLLPEDDMFDTTRYDNHIEWGKFMAYVNKRKGLDKNGR